MDQLRTVPSSWRVPEPQDHDQDIPAVAINSRHHASSSSEHEMPASWHQRGQGSTSAGPDRRVAACGQQHDT
jgi:hypothetical protein